MIEKNRRPLTPCVSPGCPELVQSPGYCETHRRQAWRYEREPSSRRGYDSKWSRLRAWYLKRNPLCESCQAKSKLVPAGLVHHKTPIVQAPELRLDPDNLQALCRDCHDEAHR